MAYTRCGIGGGGKPQLLWSNANPTSAFAAQTVSLDLSGYKTIAIKYRRHTTIAQYVFCFYANPCVVVNPTGNTIINAVVSGSDGKRYGALREVTIADTGITFGTGYNYSSSGTANIIPLEIYGIKSQIYPDEE